MSTAVIRELTEETGLTGEVGPLVGWVERIDAHHHFAIFDFEVVVDADGPLVAGDDADEAQWFTASELDGLDLVDGLAEFLHEHKVVKLRPR